MRRKTIPPFDRDAFLTKPGAGRRILNCPRKALVFSQGDLSDAVFYIRAGRVKLTVVNDGGKQATIAILEPGNFLGEECLIDRPLRNATAVAVTDCALTQIRKTTMRKAVREQPSLAELFVAFLICRQVRMEEDLVDQLFNSSEKRLARLLLLLANPGAPGALESVIPKISQETLAEMVGTTRSRVSSFMNKFRRLGYLDYGHGLRVHRSLQSVVFGD
jgi:CRP/FNR family transcriptional regulator, cyclic AMP receptor protein